MNIADTAPRFFPPITNRLGLWFAHLYVLGMTAVICGGFYFQFANWEYPCPLCILQRMFMMLAALGPAYIAAIARKRAVTTREFATGWGISILGAVCGASASTRQVLLHVKDSGYGGTVFGLHLYTWALITFVIGIIAAAVNLILIDESEPLYNSAPRLGTAVLWILGAVIAANAVSVFFEEGFHWFLPDDPDKYRLLYDLGIL